MSYEKPVRSVFFLGDSVAYGLDGQGPVRITLESELFNRLLEKGIPGRCA